MDGKKFDDLTQALASGASRRGVIRLLGGGLAAGMAASLGINRTAHAKGNSQCAALCKSLFPPGKERGQCISQGAQGQGPCVDSSCGGCPSFSTPDGTCYWLSDGYPGTEPDCWYPREEVFGSKFTEEQCEVNNECDDGGACYAWRTASC